MSNSIKFLQKFWLRHHDDVITMAKKSLVQELALRPVWPDWEKFRHLGKNIAFKKYELNWE
jgi:hypothetical protein